MRPSIRFLSFASLACAGAAFAQDLTVTARFTHGRDEPKTAVSYISRDRVRMAQGSDRETIVDVASGRFTTLDTKNRTYWVMTRQDMEDFAARMKARMESPEMKKAREQVKNLPPEQRRAIDEAMEEGTFDVRKTGGGRTIAGYRCENWTIAIGKLSRTEECLADEIPLPRQTWEMYRGFADTMKTVMASFGSPARDVGKMQEKFKDMKGFPLASTTTVTVMGNTTTIASEVIEIHRGPIPASAWEVPPGYREVDNPMLKALRPRR